MATTGTATFNMDFTEIAEEAFERAGREMRSGYDLRTARRSMNLLTIEWANRGLNMWTMDEGSIPLQKGTAEYNLPADTVDIMDAVVRSGVGSQQLDRSITRISLPTYASIPNKLSESVPLQMCIKRERDNPVLCVWPTPSDDSFTYTFWRLRRIEDAGAGVTTADVNFRFLPALIAGLAFHIAVKIPELAPRIEMLRMQYEDSYRLAAEEDREKASVRFVPGRG